MMINNFMDRLESVVSFLPPIPVVVLELLDVLNSEDANLNALAKIISKDPAMSINVLKVANSAFYKLPYKVDTIDYAVRILGMKEITIICIACGVYSTLKPAHDPHEFDAQAFWKHSVATGVIARRLTREFAMNNQAIVYLCGLLHDVGKIILNEVAHDIYVIANQTVAEEGISMVEAEKRFFGVSHDAVGGMIMEKWRLPREFSDVARYHHSVMEAPDENGRFVALQSLSDHLARFKYAFCSGGSNKSIASTEAFDLLRRTNPRITTFDFEEFVWAPEGTDNEINEMEAMLKG